MGAVPAVVGLNVGADHPISASKSPARADAQRTAEDDVSESEKLRTLLLQLAMCGAVLDRSSIEFARGIAEVLIWSAEHARAAATAPQQVERLEWQCAGCGESVPGNFDLCWNCEAVRAQPETTELR
jgi:hypothetical protein